RGNPTWISVAISPPAAGTYTIAVDAMGNSTGCSSWTLLRGPVPADDDPPRRSGRQRAVKIAIARPALRVRHPPRNGRPVARTLLRPERYTRPAVPSWRNTYLSPGVRHEACDVLHRGICDPCRLPVHTADGKPPDHRLQRVRLGRRRRDQPPGSR